MYTYNRSLVAKHVYILRCLGQTWNWVIGSPGQWVIWVIFHVRITGSPGHHFDPV